jgi:hypothetical protein
MKMDKGHFDMKETKEKLRNYRYSNTSHTDQDNQLLYFYTSCCWLFAMSFQAKHANEMSSKPSIICPFGPTVLLLRSLNNVSARMQVWIFRNT